MVHKNQTVTNAPQPHEAENSRILRCLPKVPIERPALASCLIYALLEYADFIVWVRSVNKMLPSVKFAEYKVLTFLLLHEKC